MSWKLVKEVLDAADAGLLPHLNRADKLALIRIAEGCHESNRQGRTSLKSITALISDGPDSDRTAAGDATRRLKEYGLIRLIKRGSSSHGVVRANLYELCEMPCAGGTQSPHAQEDAGGTQSPHAQEDAGGTQDPHASDDVLGGFSDVLGGLDPCAGGSQEPPYPSKSQNQSQINTPPYSPPRGADQKSQNNGSALAQTNGHALASERQCAADDCPFPATEGDYCVWDSPR